MPRLNNRFATVNFIARAGPSNVDRKFVVVARVAYEEDEFRAERLKVKIAENNVNT